MQSPDARGFDLQTGKVALRVRGMKGLRMIDASIMPAITSGNTSARGCGRREGRGYGS